VIPKICLTIPINREKITNMNYQNLELRITNRKLQMNVISHCSLVISLFSLLVAFYSPLVASDQTPGKKQEKPIALIGGTIHTVSGKVIHNGILAFSNGKIEIVSDATPLPPKYERIDITGKNVYPGMFNAGTTLGMIEIGAVRATRDVNEVGRMNPNVRAEITLNPDNEQIPVTRANGITTSLIFPGGGIISGLAAIIHLDGWTYEEMTMKSRTALVLNWPSMRMSSSRFERRTEEEQKKEREKILKEIRETFNDAKAYWIAKNANKISKRDVRWEAMVPVLEKKTPILITADEMLQIEAAVAFAMEMNLQMILYGGTDAWRVAELLKQHAVPVILNGTQNLPTRNWDAYDEPYVLPKKLADAGVKYCIAVNEVGNGDDRNLPYNASQAVAYGLSKEEALKAITLYPAQIFGVENRIGSLEVGNDATLIVTNGDVLDIRSNVEMEFIEGKKVDLSSRHTMLWEKYKKKYGKK